MPQQLPGPNGQFIEGPPTQPNFSMKGRSITKLLRLVDEWHGDLNADDYALGEEDAWEASGFRGLSTICGNRRVFCACGWSARTCGTTSEATCTGDRRSREKG